MAGLTNALRLMGLGWFVVVAVLGGFLVGRWLDDQTRLSPLFLIVGTILGLVVAFVGTRRLIRDVLSTQGKEPPH